MQTFAFAFVTIFDFYHGLLGIAKLGIADIRPRLAARTVRPGGPWGRALRPVLWRPGAAPGARFAARGSPYMGACEPRPWAAFLPVNYHSSAKSDRLSASDNFPAYAGR